MFLGAVGGPKWDDARRAARSRASWACAAALDVYANLRPARYLGLPTPLKESLVRHADILVVRELSGGVYFGEPRWEKRRGGGRHLAPDRGRGAARGRTSPSSSARRRKKHVTSVDKANVLAGLAPVAPRGDRGGAPSTRTSTLEHRYVDAASFEILRAPHAVRRDRDRQHVRRHPERRGGGDRRLDRRPALGLARRRARASTSRSTARRPTSPARASPTRRARS